MNKDSIGVDISKAHLDVHRLNSGIHARFSNDPTGFRALKRWFGLTQPALVVYEATGPYHARFEQAFSGRPPLVKVNPLQARRFAQVCGTRAKTDAADARLLAHMGTVLELEPDRPVAENQRALKELQVARTALIKDRTRLKNRLKILTLALTRNQTKARLSQVERQIETLQIEMKKMLGTCARRKRAHTILRSIPGIGDVTAAALLIECPEIGTLERKQVASPAGLAPMTRQSGNWTGKAFIQGGRKPLREALYMPALVAMRSNPDLQCKYQDMRKAGKPPKVAIIALMRKLIELANTLIKQDRTWAPKTT